MRSIDNLIYVQFYMTPVDMHAYYSIPEDGELVFHETFASASHLGLQMESRKRPTVVQDTSLTRQNAVAGGL